MPRKSLAEQLYEAEEETLDEDDAIWLLLYDFNDVKPHLNFWINLRRLTALEGSSRLIQYSAFLTDRKRIATAAKKLAGYYGATPDTFAITVLREGVIW